MRRFTQFLVVGLLLIFGQLAIHAQATNGRLIGTVTDGVAVVPNATVTVKDNQTGSTKTVVSDSQGHLASPTAVRTLYSTGNGKGISKHSMRPISRSMPVRSTRSTLNSRSAA